jgi:hypothetical protein
MKKAVMIIVTLILVAIAFLHFERHYVVWEELYSPQALGHNDECYSLVEVRTYGWDGSYLAWVGEVFKAILTIPPDPLKVLRRDVIVYRYANGTLSRHYVKNFSLGGGCFPHKMDLYYGEGAPDSNSTPPIWRWSGTEFVRLSDKEASEINAAYIGHTERFAREGWSEYYWGQFPEGEKQLPIKLHSHDLVLRLKWEPRTEKKTMALRDQGIKEPEEVLAWSDGARRTVDKRTYMELSESGADR